MPHVLNSLKIPIYGNFRALRTTLVHFADFVTGHGTSRAPCAMCHTPGALCTFICAYSTYSAPLVDVAVHLDPNDQGSNFIVDLFANCVSIRLHLKLVSAINVDKPHFL